MQNFFKKIRNLTFLVLFLGIFLNTSWAEGKTVIHFFYGNGCPHCEREFEFLQELAGERDDFIVQEYEVWYNADNAKLLAEVGKKSWKTISGVPFTLIGEKSLIGFGGAKSSGQEIISALDFCRENTCKDLVAEIFGIEEKTETPDPSLPDTENNTQEEAILSEDSNHESEDNNESDDSIWGIIEERNNPESDNIEDTIITTDESLEDLPVIESSVFGTIDLKKFSLPVITIIIGALDGFNPCAMWILLFLISMLLGMKNRKRMRILGSTFILVSGGVYFLFMAAWLNLIEILSYIVWIRAGIGIFALLGWGYNLYQYCKSSKDSGCHVVSEKKRSKIFDKIRNIVQEKSFWIALVGISILAISVNLVELLCSAGLPIVYTQILEVNNLSMLGKYAYILLYIFFFILDDLFVFFVSMKTLHLTGITTKYTKYSHMIGGILMVIIGLLLIFRPEWLMFG